MNFAYYEDIYTVKKNSILLFNEFHWKNNVENWKIILIKYFKTARSLNSRERNLNVASGSLHKFSARRSAF